MPNPYPTALRERAVRAYESNDETYVEVAERFAIGEATLQRWVRRQRDTGVLDPLAKAGGVGIAGGRGLAASAGPGAAGSHDRRIDAGVQPPGGPERARPSVEHLASLAPDGIRV